MKVSSKIIFVSSFVLLITISLLSMFHYNEMTQASREQSSNAINESSDALAEQITNWLNGKVDQIDLMSQVIDADFSQDRIQKTFDSPSLKESFLLIFGGLETDGKRLTNTPSWNPKNWDARKKPWYTLAKESQYVKITEPYADAATNDILISVVAKFTDKGVFKGTFGGDLSLKTVSDSLNTLTFNDSGYAFLLAKNGNIISHPKAENNGKNYSHLFSGKSLTLTKKIQKIEINGQSLWVSFTPLKNLKGLDWYIGVVVDESIIMATATEMGVNTLIGGTLAVLLSVIIFALVMKVILQPIALLSKSLREINSGNGDLTKRLKVATNDEFGEVADQFNIFVGNLQGIVTNVKGLAGEVEQSSEQVSNESEKSFGELDQQLMELDQLATAMNQMSSSATEVASNAQMAANLVVTANQETETGVTIVSNATDSIMQLAKQMESAVESVVELASFSNNIESILTVITAIAEQTNLLALNAAIEAARAGESGRGFAVVADEVRSLASRTQESTSEIKAMIDQLQAGVRLAETNIKESREMAMNTSEEAGKANGVLEEIRAVIVQINDMNLQIAAAAEEQSATSEEINHNTTNIRDISRDVSDGAQKQVKCASLMKQQVEEQEKQLEKFIV